MRNVMKDAIMKSLPNTFKIKKIDVTREIYAEPNDIANITNEGMDFEIETNTRLSMLENFLSQHVKDTKQREVA